jgi:glycosyltransferase involved in cell wall biosynthesis
MKLLILCQDYPSLNNPYALAYIHSRVIEYQKRDLKVKILSFSCKRDYEFEGVLVSGVYDNKSYDVLISHAVNLRSHVKFIIINKLRFSKFIFWFHGHEIINVAKEYPKPYRWSKSKIRFLHAIYTPIKFFVIRHFLFSLNRQNQVQLVFVSEWMKEVFERNISSTKKFKFSIINNPINPVFSHSKYVPNLNSKGICIRPWDNSKYAVDLVLNFAKVNSHLNIDIYGGGDFPNHYNIPSNVQFHQMFFLQKEIPEVLNNYNFAIMPTRFDSQGVLACEFATFGIPLITSSIPIMIEMLGDFNNVYFINNDHFDEYITLDSLKPLKKQCFKFDFNFIIENEIKIFK